MDIQDYISEDITKRLAAPNMTWRKLDLCFKWQMLQTYLAKRGIDESDSRYEHVRGLLRSGLLASVDYDARSQCIMRMNKSDDPTCSEIDAVSLVDSADTVAA
jgi:hypothetical protein